MLYEVITIPFLDNDLRSWVQVGILTGQDSVNALLRLLYFRFFFHYMHQSDRLFQVMAGQDSML